MIRSPASSTRVYLAFWLAIFLLLPIVVSFVLIQGHGAVDPAQAESQMASGTPTTYTIYLPLLMKYYDATIPPFSITMHGDINKPIALSRMSEAKLSWAIASLGWSNIEPEAPQNGVHDYVNWSTYDTRFSNALAAGLRPIVIITANPPWAAEFPGGPVTDTLNLVQFVSAAVERYDCDGENDAPGSPCVKHWMLYLEPDNGSEVYAERGRAYWGHNGAGYAEMLAQVYPVIKAADAEAKVIMGGLAYDWFEDQGGPFVRSFITDVLEAGGGEFIDIFAFHYYPINPDWPTIREKAFELQGILEANGFGELPMICSEIGYWSDTGVGSSEEGQARRLPKMFVRGMSVGVEILSWLGVFDHGSGTNTHGLLYADGSPKPAYYAYKTLVSELTRARFERILGTGYESIEGYVFSMRGGESEKGVLWTNPGNGEEVFQDLFFPVVCLQVVEKDGIESTILDGEIDDLDGTANGWVRIRIGGSPIYVEACP